MKIKMILTMLTAALVFASCNNDDDDDAVTKYNELAGTYKGYTVANCAYFPYMASADESLSIVANDDATVNLSFTSDTWGSFTMTNVVVKKEGSQYKLTGSGTCSMGHADSVKDYDCSLTATVTSQTNATFTFSVPSVMGGLSVVFTAGDTPANIAAACSNDGNFAMTVMGMDMGSVSTSLKVDAAEDGTATVTLGAFDLTVEAMSMSFSFGDLVMKGMAVTPNADGSYSIKGELKDCTMEMNNSSVNVSGSFEGKVADGKATGVLTYKPGSMPMDIVGTFTASE